MDKMDKYQGIFLRLYKYKCVCVYTHTHTHMYVYQKVYTHTHTHTHVYIGGDIYPDIYQFYPCIRNGKNSDSCLSTETITIREISAEFC